MTFLNEGEWDRGARVLGGVLLLGAGWSLVSGTLGMVLVGFGAVAIITGIAGWCPAYSVFGFSTRKVTSGHCRNCDTRY
jgi:DUF2892 family protein